MYHRENRSFHDDFELVFIDLIFICFLLFICRVLFRTKLGMILGKLTVIYWDLIVNLSNYETIIWTFFLFNTKINDKNW